MNKKHLYFEIEVLQRSKIILATETVAVNTLMFVLMYFSTIVFSGIILKSLCLILGLFAVSFSGYAAKRNIAKHTKIYRLKDQINHNESSSNS